MSIEVNALLCFCEGAHDVAFVSAILNKIMGFKIKEKIKFSDLPSPFNSVLKNKIKDYAFQDISINFAYNFFIPSAVLCKDDNYTYLFNCGGKDQFKKIEQFLVKYIHSSAEASIFPEGAKEITKTNKYLFLYDADADGVDIISDKIKEKFGKIDGRHFMNGTWNNSVSEFGKTMQDKAIFVLGKTPQEGTLEDILIPIFQFTHNKSVTKFKEIMGNVFSWDTGNQDRAKAIAEIGKYNKAILTASGQREESGYALSVILKNDDFLTPEALKSNKNVMDFVNFLTKFLET
jgi:hypothetical protein